MNYSRLALAAALSCASLAAHAKDQAVVSAAFKSVFYLPVYFAQEQGYFKDEGLDVRIDVASSSTNALAAVISKSADFSLHGPEWTAISFGRGAPVKVVGGTLNRLGVWLTCKSAFDFKDFTSLKGATIATGAMPTTSTSAFLKILRKAGLDPKRDVNLLEVPLGNEVGPLSAGLADCAVLYEPGASQAEAQGFKVVSAFSREIGPYTFSAISTRQDIDPHVAGKLVSGLDRALKTIHKDPEAAVQSGLKLFPNLPPEVVRKSVMRLIDDGVFADSAAIVPQALADALQTQVDLGNLDKIPADPRWLDLKWSKEIDAKTY
ncbi:ABC transporter substrate-binding protein [Bordetella avium]|uniref:ABC transporter substrate-binding protein n=1 Tax=Bordetella avium TaxID=521 RepID=UPI000E68D0A6|nr:ABC transporter substrate-binding protein [Bordetella avium]AZY48280.1 ABC transporter substrate-binding protein [Bordetella avium]AZY51664.1 ABC transporter substrate-binding protein [Bordetella avium]RIQ16570.1 ABC transporter substrate-binding protein [Bordetella avium]RIQ31330.1 ABC transporter substrate-binding protein [Bordetella avium]RIQ36819.1 ABC transporter substrate-binding protein [Bordetella avium]